MLTQEQCHDVFKCISRLIHALFFSDVEILKEQTHKHVHTCIQTHTHARTACESAHKREITGCRKEGGGSKKRNGKNSISLWMCIYVHTRESYQEEATLSLVLCLPGKKGQKRGSEIFLR